VIDGGSTDGTQALVEQAGQQVKVFVSESDKGIYDAMNKGISRSSGEVIGFVNADDYVCGRSGAFACGRNFRGSGH